MGTPTTQRTYLSALRLRLSLWCSPAQLQSAMEEYEVGFSCGVGAGHSEEEICRELGALGSQVAHIRAENKGEPGWSATQGFLCRLIPGLVVLLALGGVYQPLWGVLNDSQKDRRFDYGLYSFLGALVVVLVLFWMLRPYLKGARRDLSRGCVLLHIAMAVPIVLFGIVYAYMMFNVLPLFSGESVVSVEFPPAKYMLENPELMGPMLRACCLVAMAATLFLMICAVLQVVGGEARFFPVLIHGIGALTSLSYARYMVSVLENPESVVPQSLFALSFYALGLLIALVMAGVMSQRGRSQRLAVQVQ